MRADKFFASKFGSRTKAKAALEKGFVLRAGKPVSPTDSVTESDDFVFMLSESYVSGGGRKLERGLDVFGESVEGIVFADLGASTGGFTECLLKRGAKRVYCVDVGESQLDPKISGDERVVVMDKTNARFLTSEDFPEQIGGVVADLSFISLKLVLQAVVKILPEEGNAFVLFKPQFECGRNGLGKSGILPRKFHKELLRDFYGFCVSQGLAPQNAVNAPLRERKNVEYVLHLKKCLESISEWEFIHKISEIYDKT